jgi:hypothetical protein
MRVMAGSQQMLQRDRVLSHMIVTAVYASELQEPARGCNSDWDLNAAPLVLQAVPYRRHPAPTFIMAVFKTQALPPA